ncbi:hypothetical protein EPA93_22575 [Ktedonosporobacter rubrisoli]|uniref:Peptidase S9 prolyl oligopeptidase catalytic domain-containing protein n=1 Tax=Ktedonosporobacter rubrisoli TaxID=2509675 RepID=A0A4P6JUK4_KTERU|nr:hypothetical protein [Ktedonosporobacter rubrisoli]QBD78626.1 hypothetical protein EPA93_22575 [Ktedonosporobacter rubrisoli]
MLKKSASALLRLDSRLNVRPTPDRRLGQRVARAILALLFLTGLGLSVLPWGRAYTRSVLLLPALISASEPAPLALAGNPVRFIRTTLPSSAGPVYLDIYEPADALPLVPGKRAAIITIAGVGDNRSSPQLVNLDRALAREGLVVVNVGTQTLFNFALSKSDSEAVVQTFSYLARRPDIDPARIGLFGLSAGDVLACLAGADPRIRDRIAFIVSFGGYFDATSLVQEVGKRALMVDGHAQPWHPYYVPLQVLTNMVSGVLTPEESSLLQQAFMPGGRALDEAELAQLSPPAVAAYHLLAGDEPENVAKNMAALSPAIKAQFAALSPSSVVMYIHAPIYLLHDRGDTYVPFTQSREFATALARLHHPYDFAEFGIFQHVEVRSNLNYGQLLGDGSRLFQIASKMLIAAS